MPPPEQVVTLESRDLLRDLADELGYAANRSQRVRLMIQDGGLKIATGYGSWSPPLGTIETRVEA